MHTVVRIRLLPAAIAAAVALAACGSSGGSKSPGSGSTSGGVSAAVGGGKSNASGRGAGKSNKSGGGGGKSNGSGGAAAKSNKPSGGLAAQLGGGTPQVSTASQLQTLANQVHHPIFGIVSGVSGQIRVSRYANGSTLVTYVSGPAGTPTGNFVSVGTYLQPNAAQELAQGSKQAGAHTTTVLGSLRVVVEASHPLSAYYVPTGDTSLLIEVYAPRAGEALALLRSGVVQPIR